MRCRYSIAETLTTPFLKRALVTLPYYKKVDPQHIAKEKGLKRIVQWFQVQCELIAKHALDVATWIVQTSQSTLCESNEDMPAARPRSPRTTYAWLALWPVVESALMTLNIDRRNMPFLTHLPHDLQASMDRESNKKTGLSDDAIIASFKK